MAWEWSASPTCLPNGPASTRCSGFRANSSPFEPSLCQLPFSVAGKRDFQGGEKCANTSPEPQISGLRDQEVVQEARQFGAFLNCYRKSPQPPECVVGSGGLELRARHAVHSNRSLCRSDWP